HDYRLSAANEDRTRSIAAAAEPIHRRLPANAGGVELESRVGNAGRPLMQLDRVKAGERTLGLGDTAGIPQHRMIQAQVPQRPDDQAAPIAPFRDAIGTLVSGVERAASPVAIIQQRGEDNLAPLTSLGDDL